MRFKAKIFIAFLALAIILPASALAAGDNGAVQEGNLIVENPGDCPEGTVPVLLQKPILLLDGAQTSIIDNQSDYNEIITDLYECVPEQPLVDETPSVQQDGYPAETATETPRTYLPSTGMALILPAAGLAALGAAFALRRKRG